MRRGVLVECLLVVAAALLLAGGAGAAGKERSALPVQYEPVITAASATSESGESDFCAGDAECTKDEYTVITGRCTFDSDAAYAATDHHWLEETVAVGYWEDVSGGYLTKSFVEHEGGNCLGGARGGNGAIQITPFLYSAERDCKHSEFGVAISVANIGTGELAWSKAYPVSIPAPTCKSTVASGGGTDSSGGGGATGGATAGSVNVMLTTPVTIRRSDGTLAKTSQPALIQPFDEILARDGKATVKVKAGTLVLARNAAVQLIPNGSASAWKVTAGSVYQRGLVLVQVGDVKVQSGAFVATATGSGATVQCVSGATTIRRGTGFGTTVATLHAGEKATVPRGGRARVAKTATPKNPFWKR